MATTYTNIDAIRAMLPLINLQINGHGIDAVLTTLDIADIVHTAKKK